MLPMTLRWETRASPSLSGCNRDRTRTPRLRRPRSPTTSSILGQAPFKLDLRIAPRPSDSGRDSGRLKPVDRELLPDLTPPDSAAPALVEAPPVSDETTVAEPGTDGDSTAGAGGNQDESGKAEGAPGVEARTGAPSDDGIAPGAAAPSSPAAARDGRTDAHAADGCARAGRPPPARSRCRSS